MSDKHKRNQERLTEIKKLAETEPFCPVCGAPEVDGKTGLLLVRGYKVGDEHGWWSHCISGRPHHILLDGELADLGDDIWFTDDGKIEYTNAQGHGIVIEPKPEKYEVLH